MAEDVDPSKLEIADELIAERRSADPGSLPDDMNPTHRKIIGFIDTLNDRVGKIISWFLVPLCLVVVYEVVVRNFGLSPVGWYNELIRVFTDPESPSAIKPAPTLWAYDISRMLYGAMFMLGAGYALSKGVHIRADFLYRNWSDRAQGIIDLFLYITLYFVAMGFLFWYGADYAWSAWVRSERAMDTAWMPQLGPIRSAIPLGALFLILQGISESLKSWYARNPWEMAGMSPEIIGLYMIGAMLFAIFVGFPISFTLIFLGTVFGYWGFGQLTFYLEMLQFNSAMMEQTLSAVPLFIFMGILMEQAGLMERLFTAIQLMLSRVRGSLYIAVLFVSTIFAAATGIVGASVTILGIMAAKTMNRSGYDVQLSAGAITAGGTLGILIPPSIMLVVMGPILEVPVTDLFAAAIIPGMLMATLYVGYALVRCSINPSLGPALPEEFRAESMGIIVREFLLGLVPPAVLVGCALGSILFGLATPTEGAAMGAFGAFLLTLAYRKMTFSKFREALIKTLEISVLILFLVAASNFFGAVFSKLGTPIMLTDYLLTLEFSPYILLIIIMALIFLLGWPLEWVPIVLIIVPILLPLVESLPFTGVLADTQDRLIWFGILVAVNLQTAWLSPPVALSAYFLKGVVPEWDLKDIYFGMMQFMVIQLLGLILIITFPMIALWLPGYFDAQAAALLTN